MKIEDITKVDEIDASEFKTVVKFALIEEEDGRAHFITEMVKHSPDFGNELTKTTLALGALSQTMQEKVPMLIDMMEANKEEALNAKAKRAQGKPKLTVVQDDGSY